MTVEVVETFRYSKIYSEIIKFEVKLIRRVLMNYNEWSGNSYIESNLNMHLLSNIYKFKHEVSRCLLPPRPQWKTEPL
jgi:hypothetical protein